MFKTSVQRGRSERRGEAYVVWYVEPLSDARTKLTGVFNILVPFAADKVKVHAPPDRIARISRLIGADREVAFVHGLLDVPSEIDHVSDLMLVDFLDDRSDFDPREVGA